MIKRITEYQAPGSEKEFSRKLSDMIIKNINKVSEKREEILKEGGTLDQWGLSEVFDWRGFINAEGHDATDRNGVVHKNCNEYPGYIMKHDPEVRENAIVFAWYAKESFRELMNAGFTKDEIIKMASDNGPGGEWERISIRYQNILKEVCGDFLNTGTGMLMDDYLWVLFAHAAKTDDWFWSEIKTWGKFFSRNFARPEENYQFIVKLNGLNQTAYYIMRCAKFTNKDFPLIILFNEFRQLVEAIYPVLAEIVGATDRFEAYTGWTLDGEWVGKEEDEDETLQEDGTPFPPLADDQPEYDEDGNPIAYVWDKENRKWNRINSADNQ